MIRRFPNLSIPNAIKNSCSYFIYVSFSLFIALLLHLQVDKAILSIMTDKQMANYLSSYGDRVATLSFCRQNRTSTNKEELLQRLKEKIGSRKKKSKAATQSSMDNEKMQNSGEKASRTKPTRMVEIGWLDFSVNGYHQVRARNGGGTRHMPLDKTTTMEEILQLAKGLFFPNGNSTKGPIEDFTFSVSDFKRKLLCPHVTVGEMYEQTKLKLLRFYLCSKESACSLSSEVKEQKDSETISEDFSEEEDLQATTDSDNEEVVSSDLLSRDGEMNQAS